MSTSLEVREQPQTDRYTTSLASAIERRGYKPLLGIAPGHVAFPFLQLFPDSQRANFLYTLGIYQDPDLDKRTEEDWIREWTDPKTGYFYDSIRGQVINSRKLSRIAEDVGISEKEFREKLDLNGHRGVVVTGRGTPPSTPLHEYFHCRDESVTRHPFTDSFSPENNAYEALTDIRTVVSSHSKKGSYIAKDEDEARALIMGMDGVLPTRRNTVEALRKLKHYVETGKRFYCGDGYMLRRMIVDSVTSFGDGRGLSEVQALAAFDTAFDYVIECESRNPPIGEEITFN